MPEFIAVLAIVAFIVGGFVAHKLSDLNTVSAYWLGGAAMFFIVRIADMFLT